MLKHISILILGLLLFQIPSSWAQVAPEEGDFYRITTVPVPEGIHLEVGGITSLPDGSMAVCTRRGDVWIIENPTIEGGTQPVFRHFAMGLHEPLGLLYHNGDLYAAQRGELTRLQDINGDRIAENYQTVYAWPLSGHYHEYSFGPKMDSEGNFYVSCNVAFGDEEWWRGESRVPWRGWTIRISPDGEMTPWATGMRSPAGLGMIDDELFYTDNQGDWMGSGGIWHVKKGAFTGHPAGLRWTDMDNSPVSLSMDELYAKADPRQFRKAGRYVKPENIMEEKNPNTLYQLKKSFPEIQLPAVWLPHGVLGISNSEIIRDESGGGFGPFAGQIFVGDQGQSKVMRIDLEKVNGEWQGAAFDFRQGFQSGVMRMAFGSQADLFVGETNRGWGSAGTKNSGLEYMSWTGRTPFEMKHVKAMPDGFEIEFTLPVDKKIANDLDSYTGRSYLYKYHPVYGSPPIEDQELKIKGVKVSEDGMKVRIVVENLRQYFLHEIFAEGLRDANNSWPLLHSKAYYTLNAIPEGKKLPIETLSTYRSSVEKAKLEKKKTSYKTTRKKPVQVSKVSKAPTYKEIEALLVKHTCTACHKAKQRVVGPSFAAIANRKYSAEKIVQLIYNPQPKNWPEYATPMAAMPQVPRKDAMKIAAWINTLN
ncbi:MAG: hypothetical protein MRZ79_04275 [Bacteroidia bacterium]|nr:hypothetical protein [Bacteroidia bacterium]